MLEAAYRLAGKVPLIGSYVQDEIAMCFLMAQAVRCFEKTHYHPLFFPEELP